MIDDITMTRVDEGHHNTTYMYVEPRRGGWVKTNFKMVQTIIAMLEHKTTNDNHQRRQLKIIINNTT